MKNKKVCFKVSISFLVTTLIVFQFSSAITANSSSYSVFMFGNGVVTGNANSNNYNATFISDVKGTTRNAAGNGFVSNIGFFEQSSYFRTISIGSYSINPKSTTVGSTIGLSVFALNSQAVWAKIVSSNSQSETLNLINEGTVNYLPIPSVVGRYNVTFYANDSSGAIASVIDFFDLTEKIASGGGTGFGGSGKIIIEKCNYNWDCTPWSVCLNSKQTRSCKNVGTCIGNESKPVEEIQCSESLFDISLNLDNFELTQNKDIKFTVHLVEKLNLNKIDVHLKYSIINSSGYEIFSQIETKAIDRNLSYSKLIEGLNLMDGDYILRVDVLYGNLQRAFAEQRFNLLEGDFSHGSNPLITGFAGITDILSQRVAYPFLIFFIFVVLFIIAIAYLRRRHVAIKGKDNLLTDIEGLEVYTDNGVKIGKVYDVLLADNKIYGLAVVVDSGAPVNHDKVLIRYEFIQNMKDVIVVNSRILEHNTEGVVT